MTTRTLLLTLIAILVIPITVFAQTTPDEDRKVSGMVPGVVPKRDVSLKQDRRKRVMEFVKREFPQVDVNKVTFREDSPENQDARLERLLMGPGAPMSDAQRINYRDRLMEQAAMTENQVNRNVDDEKSSWLMVAGAALILGLVMAFWIKRMM